MEKQTARRPGDASPTSKDLLPLSLSPKLWPAESWSIGRPDMPEFVFWPEQIGDILDCLQSIQER
jgi:hypothetical protein